MNIHYYPSLTFISMSAVVSSTMNTEPVRELKYGWLSFKPRCLQLMNNSKCFLLVVAVLTVVQGLLSSFFLIFFEHMFSW